MARTLVYTPDPTYRYYISWLDESGDAHDLYMSSLYGAMAYSDDLASTGRTNVEVYMEEVKNG